MDGDIIMRGFESPGQGNVRPFRQFDVENGVATIAVKMTMLAHVWTKSGCSPLQGHLFDQTALNKRR